VLHQHDRPALPEHGQCRQYEEDCGTEKLTSQSEELQKRSATQIHPHLPVLRFAPTDSGPWLLSSTIRSEYLLQEGYTVCAAGGNKQTGIFHTTDLVAKKAKIAVGSMNS
jgi:hypothetical protein